MLFTSPRYSPLAQAKLLELTQCQKVLVCGSGSREIAESIASVSDVTLQIHSTPSIWTFLNAEHQLFPHTKTFDQAWAEPLVVLHTSGTTGFPKPVIWTHGWAAAFAFQLNLQPPEGFQSNDVFMLHNRMFSLMPPFHVSFWPRLPHRSKLLTLNARVRAYSLISSSHFGVIRRYFYRHQVLFQASR